jgi:hypothetical protein
MSFSHKIVGKILGDRKSKNYITDEDRAMQKNTKIRPDAKIIEGRKKHKQYHISGDDKANYVNEDELF